MGRHRSKSSQQQLSCCAYAVGHGEEGVCLLVQMGSYRILLDCGLEDITPLLNNSQNTPQFAFCSHAHPDHARGLLALHQALPKLPIYTSKVTQYLLPLNWLEESPEQLRGYFQILPVRSRINLAPDLTIELFPAGHIPGAVAMLLTYHTPQRDYKLFYTGDFSVSNFQLVEGLSIELLRGLAPDVLIIEGSYGTTRHPHRRQQEKQLMERILQGITTGNHILLFVPTLGLGQEILKLLRSHHQFTGRALNIWVDGTVAIACDYYLELLSELPTSVQNFAKHQALFWDERIYPRMLRFNPEQFAQSDESQLPSIILTDYNADLSQYGITESESWLILIPEHTELLLNHKLPNLHQIVNIPNIQLETYLLTEHSDGRNTTQLIHNLRPQHVIFVHGYPHYLTDLTSLEELQSRYHLHSPSNNTLVELPIGDKFIQPAIPPSNSYEGEINELDSSNINITLPGNITEDTRWLNFADTGLIEARWQGEEIVLRGLSQRELLNQSHENKIFFDVDCCATCIYQRELVCNNLDSPLYGFKVTPEGYCPVFEGQSKAM